MMMQNRELLVKHLVVHVAEPAYGEFSRYGNLTRTDIRQQIAIKQYMFICLRQSPTHNKKKLHKKVVKFTTFTLLM